MNDRTILQEAIRLGIIPRPGTTGVMSGTTLNQVRRSMARDAAPLVPNNAIPEYLLNIFNPEIIRVLLAPMAAEEIFPTVKKGSLETKTTTFIQGGFAGDVDSYGDFSHNANVDTNYNFPGYDSWIFQTHLRMGDLQAAEWGEAKINVLSDLELAAADIIKRTHNRIWFYGVNGIRNYGILTDPRLPANIAPIPDDSAKVTWTDKSALGIFNDVVALFDGLTRQSMGQITNTDPLKLVLSTYRKADLLKTNEFGVTVLDRLEKAFPKLEIVTAPEYSTAAGEVVQLIAPEVAGKKTGELGYSEMYRSHGVVKGLSSIEEKKSAGSWGAIIRYPLAIATMVGI